MESNSSILIQRCLSSNAANFIIVITVITLPFHVLFIKVLIFDLRLALPRHNTMLCLSISDTLQIFTLFLCMTTMNIFSFSRESVGCDILRSIMYFNLAMTLVVSSLSTIALSVERYVACIYSFHLHRVFTRQRMMRGISIVSIIGLICGAITVTITLVDHMGMSIGNKIFMKVITVIFIIPTSIVICIIQCRLLVFSRSKQAQVRPGTQFGREAEIADLRKKQIKVAFVASIVAVAYIVCMLPIGCISFYELVHGSLSPSSFRGILERLIVVNNFADPFIYGIGTVDARGAALKNLKMIRDFITRRS